MNEDIFNDIIALNNEPYVRFKDMEGINKFWMMKYNIINEGLDILPDGALTFYEANSKNLTFKLQINDLRIPEYHRFNNYLLYFYFNK